MATAKLKSPPDRSEEAVFWRLLAKHACERSSKVAIDKTLRLMGRLVKADRVWIARYSDDLTRFWNVHEWANRGVEPHVMDLQGASSQMMSWGHQRLVNREVIEIPDVDKMPRSAKGLRAELKRQKVGATLVFPLVYRGRLIGFHGYDHPRPVKGWSAHRVEFKKKVAMHLAGLLARERVPSVSGIDASADIGAGGQPANLSRVINVKSAKTRVSITEDEIVMLRSFGDYTWIHLINGKRFMELRSLRSWIALLGRDDFVRVHQRFVVRADRILGVEKATGAGWNLALKGWADRIPVGRTYRHLIRSKMGF
ncbi:GAF domain-containing protein [Phragmitibacter flavus]|uniref:GAF domain-containing protein n=1 Tax=Phragmitibacter flavus TaxID=2576071 RepID=A0A5R8KB00_9BACT|nr:GAF domain-containing DNA-binding protein [Phragmitibacter flavus]TLD69492.1 GAF domain-containing protein [Phragmitibacter flavus]